MLGGVGFAVYWLACLGFALAALVIAWLDWRSIRRQVRRQQRELLDRTLRALEPPAPPVVPDEPRLEAGPPSDSAARPPR